MYEAGKRPPVDTSDRPPRFLAHFEIDASGCKDGSPPVYTLLPLPAKNGDWEDAKEDVQAHTKPNQAIAKKGTSLSPIKLIPFGNEKKKDIQVTNAEEVITLGEEASAILLKKLPKKEGDPGIFSVPISVGKSPIFHGMLDLGASISVMPSCIYDEMNLKPLSYTRTAIHLADRSRILPPGSYEPCPFANLRQWHVQHMAIT